MKDKTNETKVLQWHPALYASIQIELADEADKLIFENEHQLGTKPKEIDVLIIKKNSKERICKNIGRIFRTYNIVEYKSPDDYLSVDDFYKVYGYACFYKADAPKEGQINPEEVTISFVSRNYPEKMVKHLREARHLDIMEGEKGIYYIDNDIFQMQLIVTSELQEESNLWLATLTNDLKGRKVIENLIHEYEQHKRENNYRSVMNVIVNANMEVFREVKKMCEALEELMKEELDAREKLGLQKGVQALIEVCNDLELSEDDILVKIVEKLNVTENDAKEYIAKYM